MKKTALIRTRSPRHIRRSIENDDGDMNGIWWYADKKVQRRRRCGAWGRSEPTQNICIELGSKLVRSFVVLLRFLQLWWPYICSTTDSTALRIQESCVHSKIHEIEGRIKKGKPNPLWSSSYKMSSKDLLDNCFRLIELKCHLFRNFWIENALNSQRR